MTRASEGSRCRGSDPGRTDGVDDGAAPAHDGRDETELERSDRNLIELLQEVRVVQTGVQILFGFLLTIAFQPKFAKLSSFQKADYFGTLVAAASARATDRPGAGRARPRRCCPRGRPGPRRDGRGLKHVRPAGGADRIVCTGRRRVCVATIDVAWPSIATLINAT